LIFSQPTDLFISEYVEGSSSNKYIEIYNGTGASINLNDYQLLYYANGSATATTTNTLSGTLANGSVVVYRNSAATIYTGTTTIASAVNFNGDDAMALFKISTSTFVDIFGNIGCDPGSAWTVTNTTADRTLVRNASVCGGITTDPSGNCPFPTLDIEWTQSNIDVITGLGSHTCTCITNTITSGAISSAPFTVDCSNGVNGSIAFTSTGTFNAGNVYTAQLSDASGSFASPLSIGTVTSVLNLDNINFTIPSGTVSSALYRIRIVSSNPVITGSESVAFTNLLSGGPCGTILYNENFHQANIICCDGSSGNAISTHESNHRFSEDALTYSGTGSLNLNTAIASSGYAGASGGFNTLLANSENLIMAGLDLSACGGTLSVNFGVKKSTNASTGSELILEYSTTGSGGPWTSIAKPALPTGTGTTLVWYNITSTGVIPNTVNALRWRVSGAVSFNLDDLKIICSSTVPCAVNSQPTTNSTAITTSPFCNSVDISFTAGNGNNRMIVMSTDCSITDPVDLTSYLGNRDYGAGSTTGANDFVVYTGSGNSVNVFNLLPSTTYCFKIFEFNKGISCSQNYLITATTTSFTTQACTGAALTGVLINSCVTTPASCNEGGNELVFGNAGATSFVASAANLKFSYGESSPIVATDNFTNSLTTVPAITTALNASVGCAGLFLEGTGATVPANASFLVARSTLCVEAYDWSTLCAFAPIYVIYSTDGDWGTSGNFTNQNNETSNRYLKLDITNTSGVNTSTTYSFNSGNLPSATDGDYVTFDGDGGFATAYLDQNCSGPTILPVELKYLSAQVQDNVLIVNWGTASELNNNYFDVQLADASGQNFKSIGLVKGAGTSSDENNYSFQMAGLDKGLFYIRLKQVDFDGRFNYSEVRLVKNSDGSLEILSAKDNQLLVSKDLKRGSFVGFYDITGKLLGKTEIIEDTDKIEIPCLVNGLVILKIENEYQGINVFKLILE
jgi:hypothetical protein